VDIQKNPEYWVDRLILHQVSAISWRWLHRCVGSHSFYNAQTSVTEKDKTVPLVPGRRVVKKRTPHAQKKEIHK
jgi:hypothetical protein